MDDATDAGQVAERALELLMRLPAPHVAELARASWELMAVSYRHDLWAAAYHLNGGCSDDGFEYFRGWLIAQGREVFDRAVADPDTLADVPAVREAANDGPELESEEMFGVAFLAYAELTGSAQPPVTGRYPDLGPAWDFDDADRMRQRMPRLAALLEG